MARGRRPRSAQRAAAHARSARAGAGARGLEGVARTRFGSGNVASRYLFRGASGGTFPHELTAAPQRCRSPHRERSGPCVERIAGQFHAAAHDALGSAGHGHPPCADCGRRGGPARALRAAPALSPKQAQGNGRSTDESARHPTARGAADELSVGGSSSESSRTFGA